MIGSNLISKRIRTSKNISFLSSPTAQLADQNNSNTNNEIKVRAARFLSNIMFRK